MDGLTAALAVTQGAWEMRIPVSVPWPFARMRVGGVAGESVSHHSERLRRASSVTGQALLPGQCRCCEATPYVGLDNSFPSSSNNISINILRMLELS